MKNILTSFLLSLAALPAAQITWQPSVDMYQGATNTDFIFTTGTALLAVNPSDPDNGTITLNGVSFLRADIPALEAGVTANGVTLTVGPDSAGADINGLAGPSTFGDGSFSGDPDLANVIGGATYGHATLTFSGLTVGKTYAIQILANDARSSRHNGYKMNLSDGTTNVPTSITNGTAGQADLNNSEDGGTGEESGDSIIGIFLADSTTQSFEIAGELNGSVNPGRAQINAIQIREMPDVIEAENFTSMSGIVIEPDKGATSDSIGYIDNGDWAEYLINVPEPGTYRFTFSAATNSNGGNVEIVSNGTTIGTATIPKTSGWDNWQPFTGDATFTTSGPQTIRLNFVSATNTAALYNIDWFTFEVPTGIPVVIGTTPKQTMRYGMDYERLWYWTTSLNSAERDLVAKWSVVDNDIDFIRVAVNAGYELTENNYDLSAYTFRIIPMMQEMQEANPNIKFFASPRPLDEAQDNVAWQPYPQWITGSTGSSSNYNFNWEKCGQYLVRYLRLMKSYGFKISYMDLTNEWQSNDGGSRFTQADARDVTEYIKDYIANPPSPDPTDPTGSYAGFPALTADDLPLFIAPSSWNFVQGASWINNLDTSRRRDAVDIAASHNTDKTGTAEDFAEAVINTLGPDTEIWNTELHGWKSTSGANEVLTFSFMLEAINAGFSGLSGWLAIGTTNQGHSYILNPNGTPVRNVKYFIFNKLTNTSHRGQALDIATPPELSHTTALIKDNLLTVWAINPNGSTVDLALDLNGKVSTNQTITRTRWHEDLNVEGEVTSFISGSPTTVFATVPAGSLCCFEIPLDPPGGPVTRMEAEAFDAQSGTQSQATGDVDGDQNIGWISNGDWLRYDQLTLAENASARFRIAREPGTAQPQIQVRLGSPTGTIVGIINVPETIGWQDWETIEVELSNAAGTYDVYLVFQEIGSATNASMMNLNWFALSLTEPEIDPISPENLVFGEVTAINTDQAIGTLSFSIPQSGNGQIYQVQWSDTLAEGSWTDLGEPFTGTGSQLDFNIPFPTALTKRFYRVEVSLP
ncbi:MAG: carbohydrate-binding protein [Verrucomicrobiaceae bacterium]